MKEKQVLGNRGNSLTRKSHPATARTLFMGRSHVLTGNSSASVFPSSPEKEKREEHCSTAIVEPAIPYASYRQQCRTNDTAYHIRGQIIPPRVTAGQVYLMPLIKHTDQQCTGNRNRQPGPPMQPTRQARSPSQQGKDSSVKQFIPWRGHQIYSKRLWPQHKQAEDNTQHQQQSRDAEVTRYRPLHKQNEY